MASVVGVVGIRYVGGMQRVACVDLTSTAALTS
jgi:hypothetical protein